MHLLRLLTPTTENTKGNRSRELFSLLRSKPVSLALSQLLLELLAVVALTTTLAFAQTDPSIAGQWTSVQQWPYIAGHSHLLPTGKVLFWPTYTVGDHPQLWDPATNSVTAAVQAGYDIFCTGHSFLASGKLFVSGGDNGSGFGIPNASIYDPTTGSWTRVGNMNAGRWYPTNTTLANGDVLVVSGTNETGTINTLPQVWQSATGTWRDLTSAQLSQPLYPRMFLAPNGKVAFVAPVTVSQYLDTSGTGTWSTLATENYGSRDYGNAVMYDIGKVLLNGGGDPPTATAEVIDLNAPTPSWRYIASMNYPRRQSNATLLPDGKVFVTGGSSGSGFDDETHPVYPAEIWDPASEGWTTVASLNVYRGYHSTAVLLPDGRVVSGGGEKAGATYEIYSPPYLFKGARPTITSAPASVGYGQIFFVQTPDAANISQVTWVRLSSVTHAFNQNQRLLHLSFSQGTGGLNVTSPANVNLSPPGDYMLFIVNSNGVPSVASTIRNSASPSSPPVAPSNLTATATLSATNLTSGVVTTGSRVTTASVTPAANALILLEVRNTTGTNPPSIPSVNGNGLTWVQVATKTFGTIAAPTRRVTLFRAMGSAPTSGGITIDFGGVNQSNGCAWSVDQWTGVDTSGTSGSGAILQSAVNAADSATSITATLAAFASPNNAAYGAIGATGNAAPTVGSGFTALGSNATDPLLTEWELNTTGVIAKTSLASAIAAVAVEVKATSQINLSWVDNSDNETGFLIERSSDGTNFTQIATVGANITSYSDTGLSASTTYYYRVRASGGSGTSNYSNVASATTESLPGLSLSSVALSPTSVTGGSSSTGTVTLSGAAPAGGAAVTLSSSNTVAATVPASVTVAAGATSATFTVTTSAVSSSTAVTISGTFNGGTQTATLTVNPPSVPAAPTNLIGTAISNTQINVTWTDNANNEEGFTIQRSTDGRVFTPIATVGANLTSYSDTGLSATTFYYYRVAAFNSVGTSAFSNVVKVRTKK